MEQNIACMVEQLPKLTHLHFEHDLPKLKNASQEKELKIQHRNDTSQKRRNQFTLSTVPAVAPEVRTLSSIIQPGGNQLGFSDEADFGDASVPLEPESFLVAGESPFPALRGSARNGDRRVEEVSAFLR